MGKHEWTDIDNEALDAILETERLWNQGKHTLWGLGMKASDILIEERPHA